MLAIVEADIDVVVTVLLVTVDAGLVVTKGVTVVTVLVNVYAGLVVLVDVVLLMVCLLF